MSAEIKTPQHLANLFKGWKSKGFRVKLFQATERVKTIYELMKSKKAYNTAGMGKKLDLRNFLIREFKPSTDAETLKPYPLFRDNKTYIVLPLRGQMSTQRAIKVNIPGIRWIKKGQDELIRFVFSKPEALSVLKKMITAGIKINNLKEISKQIQKMNLVKRQGPKKGEED
jgi:hypothetical protein